MPDPDYNRGDYTGWTFISLPHYQWSDRTVRGASFSQEIPDTRVFTPETKNMRFIGCNLDNVLLPPGSTVQGCSTRRFRVRNDLRDWEEDAQGNATKVLNEKFWTQVGVSVKPSDIPAQKIQVRAEEDLKEVLLRAIPAVAATAESLANEAP